MADTSLSLLQQFSRLQQAVNVLGRAYGELHHILQTKVVVDYEKQLVDLQSQTQKTVKETEALDKAFRELAKDGKYSSTELASLTEAMTSNSYTAKMSNEEIKRSINNLQTKFPVGADKAIASLKALSREFIGLGNIVKTGLEWGKGTSELLVMKAMLDGDFDKVNEIRKVAMGVKAELMPNTMAFKKSETAIAESQLSYAQTVGAVGQYISGATSVLMGGKAGLGVQLAFGALQGLTGYGRMKEAGSDILHYSETEEERALRKRGKGGGSGGAGGSGASGQQLGGSQNVFVTNWPLGFTGGGSAGGAGGIWNWIKGKMGWGAGAAGGTGGAAATGTAAGGGLGATASSIASVAAPVAAIVGAMAVLGFGDALLPSFAPDWMHLTRNKYRDVQEYQPGLRTVEGDEAKRRAGKAKGKSGKTVEQENADAEATNQRNAAIQNSLELAKTEMASRQAISDKISQEIGMSEVLGSHWSVGVDLLGKQMDAQRSIVEQTQIEINQTQSFIQALKDGVKQANTEEEKRIAILALKQAETIVDQKKATLQQEQNKLAEQGIQVIEKEAAGRMKLISFRQRELRAQEGIAKATYMPAGAAIASRVGQIAEINNQIEVNENEQKQMMEKRDTYIAEEMAKGKSKEEAGKGFVMKLGELHAQGMELQQAKAEAADYVRRGWMEQMTPLMLGGESGTYLLPGSGALSGMQEQGAAFSPFGDANRGGGIGAYADLYGQFDPALQESRTAGERSLAELLAGAVKRVVEVSVEEMAKGHGERMY